MFMLYNMRVHVCVHQLSDLEPLRIHIVHMMHILSCLSQMYIQNTDMHIKHFHNATKEQMAVSSFLYTKFIKTTYTANIYNIYYTIHNISILFKILIKVQSTNPTTFKRTIPFFYFLSRFPANSPPLKAYHKFSHLFAHSFEII